MTDKLTTLYQTACREDAQLLDGIDAAQLIDLAEGRLTGEARAQLVEAIAASPSLAAAYRMARASGDWSRRVAAELAGETAIDGNVRALPLRPAVAAPRRQRWALAAAVSAMAIGAVFVSQQIRAPSADVAADDVIFAAIIDQAHADGIMVTSFDASRMDRGEDRIFSSRGPGEADAIFDQSFGNGS